MQLAFVGFNAAELGTWIAVLVFAYEAGGAAAAGAFLPIVFLLAWRPLVGIDASVAVPGARLALLRSLPIFAPLSAPPWSGSPRA